MTTAVQRRRGTNTEHASFTGLEGEISVNTTNESVHVHDGSTAGGFELMRADGANSTVTLGDISGVTAGTGLSGGGTTGTVTLDIDGTVATLAGTQTFTNKTLTSPILNTPTIGTSFTIGGATITEAELEILDGATVTTTELNYVDGVTSAIQTQIDAKAPLASPSFTGNVSVGGTVDGRDVATDGTKLDGIEASADVTDTANVTAAGAVMDSELTSEASVKALNQGVATTDSPAFAGLTVDTDTLAVDSTNNRVGIGTSSPDANLVVYETATSGTDHFAQRWRTQSGGVLSIACSDLSLANPTWQIRSGSSEPIAFNQASNERMRIDSSGRVTMPYQPAFNARAAASATYSSGFQKLTYNVSVNQRGNHYSSSTSRFTAPVTGWYQFNASINFASSSDIDGALAFMRNGSVNDQWGAVMQAQNGGNYNGRSVSTVIQLDANDYVEVTRFASGGVSTTTRSNPWTGNFSGFLIG